jgi:hypothetical protein
MLTSLQVGVVLRGVHERLRHAVLGVGRREERVEPLRQILAVRELTIGALLE